MAYSYVLTLYLVLSNSYYGIKLYAHIVTWLNEIVRRVFSPNGCISGVPEIRGLMLKEKLVDLLHTEPACFFTPKHAKSIAKIHSKCKKKNFQQQLHIKIPKSQSTAALLHAARGHSSMVIP